MEDRHAVCGALLGGVAIEIVVEDGLERSVGPGADIESPRRGRLDSLGAEGFDQTDDAETRPEALFGVRALLEDQLAQSSAGWSDRGGIAPDAVDRPVGVTAMAGGHVLEHGSVLAVAAGAQMRGDPLAPGEHLDGSPGHPRLDGLAGKAIRHAVVMPVDIDVIIDADAADTPLGEHVGLDRQGLEPRAIEFFEKLAPCHAEPPDRPLIVETDQQRADRLIERRQAVEALVAKPSDNPALHDEHGGFDLGLVAWLAGPGAAISA